MHYNVLLTLIKCLFTPLSKLRLEAFTVINALRKENEIHLRRKKLSNIRILFTELDRKFFAFFNILSGKIKNHIKIVKPETILKWTKACIKNRWTYPHKKNHVGRPRTAKEIRELILEIRNKVGCGYGKIQGELKKLGIPISETTIQRILRNFRKNGKIKEDLTWSKFIKTHIESLYATDFFTLDTILGIRYYVIFFICHKTRKIINYNVTHNPTKKFVKQQLIEFEGKIDYKPAYLIHDGSGEYAYIDYSHYSITSTKIPPKSPNMNPIAERFIKSIRNEAFDCFILFNEKQIRRILKKYIYGYYNRFRPHQGIDQNIPDGYEPQSTGKIVSMPVLSGLHRHYYRKAA